MYIAFAFLCANRSVCHSAGYNITGHIFIPASLSVTIHCYIFNYPHLSLLLFRFQTPFSFCTSISNHHTLANQSDFDLALFLSIVIVYVCF